MPFAALAELVVAGVLELRLLRARGLEALECLPLEAVETCAAERGRRAAQVLAAERAIEPDRIEQPGAAVARDVGDAHLGHDLQDALLERGEEAALRLVGSWSIAADPVVRGELRDRLECEPRTDRVGAVAEEARDRMRVARLVRLHEQRAARAEARFDQSRMHGRESEDRGHRGTLVACVSVGEADELRARRDCRLREHDDPVEGSPEPLLTRERRVEPKGRERLEPGRVEEEPGEYREPWRRAVDAEHVDARPEQRCHGHDEALAEVVDRGVRHLREALSEVGGERARAAGERCDRGVVAHRRDGVVAGLRQRAEHRVQLLARVAVEDMSRVQAVVGSLDRLACVGGHGVRRNPAPVRTPPRELAPQLVPEQEPVHGIDDEDPARAETRAPDARTLGERYRPRLGCNRDEPVVGDRDAQRPKPVAVECGSARPAVREAEGGRAVPRLAEHRAVAVEVTHLRIETRIVLPRGRDEERHGFGQVLPLAAHDEVERVVEERRVGSVAIERGREAGLGFLRAEPGLHPRDVPVDGVDLAVVAEEPERLGALPTRLRVGREALMEDRERDLERGILEVGVEVRELAGGAESLVGDRAERERDDVDAGHALRPPPCAIRASLGVRVLGWSEHELFDARKRGKRGHADRLVACGHGPPAGWFEALRAAGILDRRSQPALAEEAHREAGVGPATERVRQREENSGAVAGDAVRGPRTAMPDRREPGERAVEHVARRATVDVRDEADAARIALA